MSLSYSHNKLCILCDCRFKTRLTQFETVRFFFLCVCVFFCLFFVFWGGSLFPLIQRTLFFLFLNFFFFYLILNFFPLGKHTHTHTHTQKEKNPHLNRWHKENWKKTTYLPILIFFSPVTGNKELGGGTGNAKGGWA